MNIIDLAEYRITSGKETDTHSDVQIIEKLLERVRALQICEAWLVESRQCHLSHIVDKLHHAIETGHRDAIEHIGSKVWINAIFRTIAERAMDVGMATRWISVSERLPLKRPSGPQDAYNTQEMIVLVSDRNSVWQATFVISGDPDEKPEFLSQDYLKGFGDGSKVTHWMPLPAPPTDGK